MNPFNTIFSEGIGRSMSARCEASAGVTGGNSSSHGMVAWPWQGSITASSTSQLPVLAQDPPCFMTSLKSSLKPRSQDTQSACCLILRALSQTGHCSCPPQLPRDVTPPPPS